MKLLPLHTHCLKQRRQSPNILLNENNNLRKQKYAMLSHKWDLSLWNDDQYQVDDHDWQKYHSGLFRVGECVGDEDEDEGDQELKEEGGERASSARSFFVLFLILFLQASISSSCFANLHRNPSWQGSKATF